MSNVYVFLAEGFEEVEAMTPVDLLRRAGVTVETVSVTDSLLVTGARGITVAADKMFAEVVAEEKADMIIMPGGLPGVTNLKAHASLGRLIIEYKEDKKLLAAICAGPSIYGEMGILNGVNAICYPGWEEKLYNANIVNEPVVYDGQFITSRGVGTAIDFSLKLIEILVSEEKAKEIAKSIVYSE